MPWRILFRFSFLYWALYLVPSAGAVSLFDLIPFGGIGDKLATWCAWPLGKLAHLVGTHVFHLTGEAADWHPTGAGDTAMQYCLVLCVLVLATVGTAVWSAIAERRGGCREYTTAYAYLRLALRITLAITLLGYGFAKVFPGQFGLEPRLAELNETYGESSPMHLLWFFMGTSRPYAIFGGLMEVIPGVLLLFERTEMLGAMGSAAVMLNVAALNYFYDVPVKLYSTHLFLMSLFLLLPAAKPMWEFFVLRKPAELRGLPVPRAERKALRVTRWVAFGLMCALCVWVNVVGGYMGRNMPEDHSALYGVWDVVDGSGWPDGWEPKQIVFDAGTLAQVRAANDAKKWYRLKLAMDTVTFLRMDKVTTLHWQKPEERKMTLQGTWNGVPVTMGLRRVDPDKWLLQSRGFHWVQESAFNK